jgi:pimeloyl-ACP methyl ester carboxylesterase
MLAELIRLNTSDGLTHYGAFYQPPSGAANPLGVVLVHGLTGSFVGEIESALPPLLAEAGFATLVANNRGTGIVGGASETLDGCIPDIRAAIDLMEARGFKRIALFGHSKAGAKVPYYLIKTGDRRVSALGVLSPVSSFHDIPVWFAEQFGGRRKETWLERARERVAKGKGESFLTSADWPFLISAKTAVDHAEATGDDVLENLGRIRLPRLAACGSKELDWCTVVARLMISPLSGCRTEVIDGADHVYTGREKQLAELMVEWMGTVG